MPAPADDGVSPFYWDLDALIDRATGRVVLDENGDPVLWKEPEPDPNESLPYEGPTIWAIRAYRLDLPEWTWVTLWVEKPTETEAVALFNDTAGAGMGLLHISKWEPTSLAHHLRWLNGHEGNLAAIISRNEVTI